MKSFLRILASALFLGLALSACSSQKPSAYAPIIPPPTYKADPALLGQAAPNEETETPDSETPPAE